MLVPPDAVGAVGVPVRAGDAKGALSARLLVTVAEKLASSPSAAASSFRVSRAPGALSITLATAVETNAVVATCVLLVPAVAVGAVGVPVRAGDAKGALRSSASCSPSTLLIT